MTPPEAAQPESGDANRFESLRRAQLAFAALEEDKPVPVEAKPPARAASRSRAKPSTEAAAPAAPAPDGIVRSQAGRPEPAKEGAPDAGPVMLQSVSAQALFEQLLMAQERLAQSLELDAEVSESGVPILRALTREERRRIDNAATMKQLDALLEAVAAYYKMGPAELEAEKRRLMTLDPTELAQATKAYQFAAHHVRILSDTAYAQKVARDSGRDMRNFFEQHGTTTQQLEAEHVHRHGAPRP